MLFIKCNGDTLLARCIAKGISVGKLINMKSADISLFFFLNRKLCSSATESKEATETDESKLDPPAHLLQTKGMGTPVLEEHTPGIKIIPVIIIIIII